jgi:hypothetical protein
MAEILRSRTYERRDISHWWARRQAAATMQVSHANLEEIRPWEIKNGKIVNLDGKTGNSRFFEVVGRMIAASGREVDAFGQPGIVEVADPNDPDGASGTVALLVDKKSGDVLVTVAAEPFQAKPGAKPGEYLSLRASIQGSFTNIEENKVPFSELVNQAEYNHFISSNSGRIEGKIRVGYTLVDKETIDLSKQPNSAWFSLEEIDQAISNNLPFNPLFHTAFNIYRSETPSPSVEVDSPPVEETPTPKEPQPRSRIKRFFRRLFHPIKG